MPTFKDANVAKGPHNHGIVHASTQHKQEMWNLHYSCPWGYIYTPGKKLSAPCLLYHECLIKCLFLASSNTFVGKIDVV